MDDEKAAAAEKAPEVQKTPHQHAEKLGVHGWAFAAVKAGKKWEDGWPLITEAEFAAALKAATSVSLG